MKCARVRELLSAVVDGRASASERAAVLAHAVACEACAHELRWCRALKAASAARPRASAPADLKAAMKAELRRRQALASAPPPAEPGFWESLRLSWRLAMTGAAGAAALAAGALIVSHYSAGSEDMPLEALLDAHRRYALTMPAADTAALYAEMSEDLSDEL